MPELQLELVAAKPVGRDGALILTYRPAQQGGSRG